MRWNQSRRMPPGARPSTRLSLRYRTELRRNGVRAAWAGLSQAGRRTSAVISIHPKSKEKASPQSAPESLRLRTKFDGRVTGAFKRRRIRASLASP